MFISSANGLSCNTTLLKKVRIKGQGSRVLYKLLFEVFV